MPEAGGNIRGDCASTGQGLDQIRQSSIGRLHGLDYIQVGSKLMKHRENWFGYSRQSICITMKFARTVLECKVALLLV